MKWDHTRRLRRLLALALASCTLLAPALARGEDGNAADDIPAKLQNRSCRFENDPKLYTFYRMKDFEDKTSITLTADTPQVVFWDAGVAVETVTLRWLSVPVSYCLEALDAAGTVLDTVRRTDGAVRAYLRLPPGTAKLRLTTDGTGTLSELHFWGPGEVKGDMLWEPPCQKADLLLIVAHADDEHVMMGGIIPTYAAERGLNVQVVYCEVVTHTGNYTRIDEALAGLRINGMHNCPVFLPTYEELDKTVVFPEQLTALIRRFRPSVVVTHDLAGEYGKDTHIAVSRAAADAVEAAADPLRYPVSAGQYGCWETLKFYRHLGSDALIRLDFDRPLAAFDGKTAFEMAVLGFECHKTQNERWKGVLLAGTYDCRLYSLVSSCVGADETGDDLFEHIPPEAYATYTPPPATPSPTPSPTPASTPVPTLTPVPTTALTAVSEQSDAPVRRLGGAVAAWIGVGCAAVAAGLILFFKKKRG